MNERDEYEVRARYLILDLAELFEWPYMTLNRGVVAGEQEWRRFEADATNRSELYEAISKLYEFMETCLLGGRIALRSGEPRAGDRPRFRHVRRTSPEGRLHAWPSGLSPAA